MFNYYLFKKKEIADELKSIETVIDTKIKENTNIDVNRFLLAEKNCIPYYVYISANKLMNANDSKICFFDLEAVMKLTPRGVDNRIGDKKSRFSLKELSNSVSNLLKIDKIKQFFSFSSNGFDILSKAEIKSREILKMAVNSLGYMIAMITNNNLLILVNLERESKINKFKFK